jgi:poly(3-hydroxybutyrate) depolymerase
VIEHDRHDGEAADTVEDGPTRRRPEVLPEGVHRPRIPVLLAALTLLLLFTSTAAALTFDTGTRTATVEAAATIPAPTTTSPPAPTEATTATTAVMTAETTPETTPAAPPTTAATAPATAEVAVSIPTTTAVSCPSGDRRMASGGMERRYVVTRPDASRGAPATRPVLLLFHGYTGSPESVTEVSDLPARAADAGWVVVAPQGSGSPSRWAIQDLPGPDDVAFVRDLIREIAAGGCADSSRVAAAGYSNGAGFTAVLTCELDLVASAMVGGANLGPTCAVPAGHPIVIAHGQADDVVPVAGGPVIGGALTARPLVSTVNEWQAAGASVREVVVPGWGHGWPPGATDAVLAALATFAA